MDSLNFNRLTQANEYIAKAYQLLTQSIGTPSQLKIIPIGIYSNPTTNLIEFTVAMETGKTHPKVFAMITFVPGVPDNTKQSGRTYDTSKRETIKFSIEELYELGEALIMAAHTGQSDFNKFADSSKFNSNAEKVIKTVNIATNGDKIFLNYKGKQKIGTAFTKWSAVGLGNVIKKLADMGTEYWAKYRAMKQLYKSDSNA